MAHINRDEVRRQLALLGYDNIPDNVLLEFVSDLEMMAAKDEQVQAHTSESEALGQQQATAPAELEHPKPASDNRRLYSPLYVKEGVQGNYNANTASINGTSQNKRYEYIFADGTSTTVTQQEQELLNSLKVVHVQYASMVP